LKSYTAIWLHLIWTTKNRSPLLHVKFRIDLFQFIKKNAEKHGYIVDTINGIEDHVHALVRLKPTQKIAGLVKQVKGSSSRWINRREMDDFAWQTGYGALSVSPSDIDRVRKYIIHQEKHHKNWSLLKEVEKFEYYNSF